MRSCLILGCGRSGTSLTAGLLETSGFYVGSDLWQPRDANPRGFFEDREVNRVNEIILNQVFPVMPFLPARLARWLNLGQHYKHTLWLEELTAPVSWDLRPKVARRIARLANHEPFAYKDPRFCYTLNAWRPVLPASCRFVCVFRKPGVVAASILREVETASYLSNIEMSAQQAIRLWTSMYRLVLDFHCQDPARWLFVSYQDLIGGQAAPRIGQFLKTSIDASMLNASLNRSRSLDLMLPSETADLYERLLVLSLAGLDD